MYKYRNNLLPTAIYSFFPTPLVVINTRSDRDYTSALPCTDIRKMSIKYQGHMLWNSPSRDTRDARCLAEFKRLRKTHTLLHVD